MKFGKHFLALTLAAVSAFLACSAQAATTFSGVGNGATTLSYFVASANEKGEARVNYINATTDKTNSVIQFYTAAAPVKITASGATDQAVVTAVGTSFAANDIVVIRHVVADTYDRVKVSAATATNVTMTANLPTAVVSGDLIYKMTAAGSIGITVAGGTGNKELNAAGGGIYNGREGRPLLMEVDGTSACKINVVSGVYQR